jgi:DNA-binding response OmpR family regulator
MRALCPYDVIDSIHPARTVSRAKPSGDEEPDNGGLEGPVSGGRRSGPAPRNVRIVLAEADEKVRDWLRRPLSRLTVNVREATTGPELEALLREEGPFDLVITNAQLPGGQSGLQVLARLRARGEVTPFIVVTSIHESLLRVFVSDAEGTVLSSRMVDPNNLVALASSLMPRIPPSSDQR